MQTRSDLQVRKKFQTRSMKADLTIREAEEGKIISGYFAVFGIETELWPGAYEEIDSHAFDNTFSNDIRALVNHDTTLVLGRNKAGTLSLKIDQRGLWGEIRINEQDIDAMNLYHRVQRGDVDQCSFGFNIRDEHAEYGDDGSAKWTLLDIDLHEVSVCTFPAYEETGVQARHAQLEEYRARKLEQRKHEVKEKLKKCLDK